MIKIIYIIILSYFILGGIGFYFINRKRDKAIARKSYTKFITYFFIIHLLFFSIVIKPEYFNYLAITIVAAGVIELFRLYKKSAYKNTAFYLLSNIVFAASSIGFLYFSRLPKEMILFAFLILSIFDSFSQISGQLWGKTKLFPTISPNKTLGGLVGGTIMAIASGYLLKGLYESSVFNIVMLILGIVLFAFIGDIAASYFKRKYKVKDYSNLIPGHGGFLDRFDSLIAGGMWVAIYVQLIQL
ncbi:MAG: phosphatidate cytidylyltransferase [Carboxylicivirga sp.]|jgi:phosphatidate cytidylyltransferase|nr:phosphatidate cytidylyltransferase [Carboxylicivirga sp.]